MAHPVFFSAARPMSIADIAALTKAELLDPTRGDIAISAVANLQEAGPRHIAFYDNARYADDLALTTAGACLVGPRFADQVPSGTVVLRSRKPFAAFVEIARHFHAQALRPTSGFGLSGIAVSAVIHPQAHLEDDVTVDPLAVIGPGAEIGSDTVIGSGTVIGACVRIGRNCSIGAGVTIQHALIGNNVIVHPGCHIGQDGFGFLFVDGKHRKVPQTGRVIIQHDVEIGSGSAIDRGSVRDTVIGEGTKIDNQVQIGHNVSVGRHCVIAGQCGLSGSITIGDNVALGARVGTNNHLHIGTGAQIAAISIVHGDVPDNARWGGTPAKPVKQWIREMMAVQRLGLASHKNDRASKETGNSGSEFSGLTDRDEG